jgi:hypothetical protein
MADICQMRLTPQLRRESRRRKEKIGIQRSESHFPPGRYIF